MERVLAIAAGSLGLLLTGCSPGRTVVLTNDTPTAVRATVARELIGSGDRTLASAVVPAGESATLGPVSAPLTERVTLRVDAATGLGAGVTESERLGWGKTRRRIVLDEMSPTGLALLPDDRRPADPPPADD